MPCYYTPTRAKTNCLRRDCLNPIDSLLDRDEVSDMAGKHLSFFGLAYVADGWAANFVKPSEGGPDVFSL